MQKFSQLVTWLIIAVVFMLCASDLPEGMSKVDEAAAFRVLVMLAGLVLVLTVIALMIARRRATAKAFEKKCQQWSQRKTHDFQSWERTQLWAFREPRKQ